MKNDAPWHYYEAHVTLEPVFDDRLERLKAICTESGFRVATLLMQRRAEDTAKRSKNDSFCTGRSSAFTPLLVRMFTLIADLQRAGFVVWRYKIESTLIDSRYDDAAFPLDKGTLPEKERNPRPPTND